MTLIASNPIDLDQGVAGTFTSVAALDDFGDVVGVGGTTPTAMIWVNSPTSRQARAMAPLDGDTDSIGLAINNLAQAVGGSGDGAGATHAVEWKLNSPGTQLASLGANSRAFGINDSGVVVGAAINSAGLSVAVEIVNGTATALGNLPGGDTPVAGLDNSRAFAINDENQVVGFSLTTGGVQHATLWQNGVVTDLGALPGGTHSFAKAINDSGLIGGFAIDANQLEQAVLWQNGAMTELPDLQAGGNSKVLGLNNSGLAVGFSQIETAGGWAQHATLWQNGQVIDLNSLMPAGSGWVLTEADDISNYGQIAGMGTLNGVATAFELSIGDTAVAAETAQQAAQLEQKAAVPFAGLSVVDSAANIVADQFYLSEIAFAGKLLRVTFTDSGTPTLTEDYSRYQFDTDFYAAVTGPYTLEITNARIEGAIQLLSMPHVSSVAIQDDGWSIENNIDLLQSWAASGKLSAISLSQDQDTGITLSAQTALNDMQVLKEITYYPGEPPVFSITGATVSQISTFEAALSALTIGIVDTLANVLVGTGEFAALRGPATIDATATLSQVQANWDALNAVKSASPDIQSVTATVTDPGFQVVTMTDQRYGAMSFALAGNVEVIVQALQANDTISGAPGTTIVAAFSGRAADYSLTDLPDGEVVVTDTGTGRVSVDHLQGVTALQFSDATDLIAAPPGGFDPTSGNVAALYAAVLAREPDVAGVGFYQQVLAKDPGLSTIQLAGYFLQSPEYTGNAAHAYGQNAVGDAQFVTDTYANLLHRAPDSGAVTFYQNVIAQFTAGLAPGSAAYAAAQLQGHAQVLVYFSASSEFLGDVQITAQHPADAQHWLYVV